MGTPAVRYLDFQVLNIPPPSTMTAAFMLIIRLGMAENPVFFSQQQSFNKTITLVVTN